MQVYLNVSGRDLSPSLRALIEQHFRFAAVAFRSVQAIHVTLIVAEGPGAGMQGCEAEVELRNGGTLKIRRQDASVEYAVQRVADRIFRSLRSLRSRRRSKAAVATVA